MTEADYPFTKLQLFIPTHRPFVHKLWHLTSFQKTQWFFFCIPVANGLALYRHFAGNGPKAAAE